MFVCEYMHAESININEAQGSRNDLMQFHSEAKDSVTPLASTASEQTDNVVTPQMNPRICKYLMSIALKVASIMIGLHSNPVLRQIMT